MAEIQITITSEDDGSSLFQNVSQGPAHLPQLNNDSGIQNYFCIHYPTFSQSVLKIVGTQEVPS